MFYNILIARVGKIQFMGVHSRQVYTSDAWKTVKNAQILKSVPDWKGKKVSVGFVKSAWMRSGGRDTGRAGRARPESC